MNIAVRIWLAPLLLFSLSCTQSATNEPAAAEPSRPHTSAIAFSDSFHDGTPDFLRLDTEADQATFNRWFTFLAELQYFTPAGERPHEIVDCSSLLRYCYREALRRHDSPWIAEARLLFVPPYGTIEKYTYPRTPLKANLFRTRDGAFLESNLTDGSFSQFADAENLLHFNTYRITRDIHRAQPGDLLFFERTGTEGETAFHSMIFLGPSQMKPSSAQYVVYDTGLDGARSGEIRRLTVSELLQFPDPQWRPYAVNPIFLGVFRWNILHNPA